MPIKKEIAAEASIKLPGKSLLSSSQKTQTTRIIRGNIKIIPSILIL